MEQNMANLMSLTELYIMAGDQLDSIWQFFVAVHLAIIGVLFGLESFRNLRKREFIILGASYLLFSFINCRAKIISYGLLESLVNEINLSITVKTKFLSGYFLEQNFSTGVGDRVSMVIVVHILSAIIIGYLYFFKSRNNVTS